MNNRWMPLTAGVLAVFIVLGLACASVEQVQQRKDSEEQAKRKNVTYTGEETPLLAGTTWNGVDSDDGRTYTVEFQPNGKLVMSGSESRDTWQRTGNRVQFVTGDDVVHWEGTYDPDTQKIAGSTQSSRGEGWEFVLERDR